MITGGAGTSVASPTVEEEVEQGECRCGWGMMSEPGGHGEIGSWGKE